MSRRTPKSKVTVTLANAEEWNKIRNIHEMKIHRKGRLMAPFLYYAVKGLDPTEKYGMMLFMSAVDKRLYDYDRRTRKYVAEEKERSGMYGKSCIFHPYGFQTGRKWMKRPFIFNNVKLSKRPKCKSKIKWQHIYLKLNHRYRPVLGVVKLVNNEWEHIKDFEFPKTSFVAVSNLMRRPVKRSPPPRYRNRSVAQLQVRSPHPDEDDDENNSADEDEGEAEHDADDENNDDDE